MPKENPFSPSTQYKIYHNQTPFKWLALALAFLIGTASIYYNNIIITQLKDREEKSIRLYANALKSIINESNDTENMGFIFQEIIVNNNSIPVIETDGDGNPLQYKNIDLRKNISEMEKDRILRKELDIMKEEHPPIMINFSDTINNPVDRHFIYYKNSKLLDRLRYYPYVQLSIIAIFGLLAYLAFNYSKTAEQNRIWVGLAKETAHQLGTPISSLIAWLEYFRSEENLNDKLSLPELEKDIQRLEMITARFSSIGSVPILNYENIPESISNTVNYLQKRLSTKVHFNITALPVDLRARINRPLFDWVIENICKNAVDAMSGIGNIDIDIRKGQEGNVIIDISDTGKGIPKSKIKHVFQPGYTTKTRGWGLGLALVKRIIENYHQGKILVKSSELGKGTTFRIILKY
jgi:two-component system, sporulation sensor kinase E